MRDRSSASATRPIPTPAQFHARHPHPTQLRAADGDFIWAGLNDPACPECSKPHKPGRCPGTRSVATPHALAAARGLAADLGHALTRRKKPVTGYSRRWRTTKRIDGALAYAATGTGAA